MKCTENAGKYSLIKSERNTQIIFESCKNVADVTVVMH